MSQSISIVGDLISNEIKYQVTANLDILKKSLLAELKKELLGNFYLSRKELKDYLRFKSITSVDNLVKYGLPKYKVNSKTLFKRFEVDEFIERIN